MRPVKKKVLFICVQNSARSQIAAALLNELCGDYFEAQGAGLEPGVLNPLAVEALQERGIDISRNKTQSVFDVWKSAQHIFAYAITVCSESEAEGCPIFTGVTTRLHWSFPDPAKFTGTHAQRLAKARELLKEIRAQIEDFCEEHCAVELQT
jgi:arsenate reductase (thioredoxin)